MLEEEILRTVRRIVRDFAPILPGVRLEVVSAEAFQARLRGRPILPGETPRGPGAAGAPAEAAREGAPPAYPLHAFAPTRVVMVDIEGLSGLVNREDRRLQRVLVEGMILREIIYLATSRQPLPDPRGRAEAILRRYWPFQYAAVRSTGLVGEAFGQPRDGRELAGEG